MLGDDVGNEEFLLELASLEVYPDRGADDAARSITAHEPSSADVRRFSRSHRVQLDPLSLLINRAHVHASFNRDAEAGERLRQRAFELSGVHTQGCTVPTVVAREPHASSSMAADDHLDVAPPNTLCHHLVENPEVVQDRERTRLELGSIRAGVVRRGAIHHPNMHPATSELARGYETRWTGASNHDLRIQPAHQRRRYHGPLDAARVS
jgi:hypothetical protein